MWIVTNVLKLIPPVLYDHHFKLIKFTLMIMPIKKKYEK